MGWRERFMGILDFRLIEPGFDGRKKLHEYLGLNNPVEGEPVDQASANQVGLEPMDEKTLKMIRFLKHESDEDPN